MELSDLIFTGFNKRVAALDRHTGQVVWQWKAMHNGYVTLLLDGGLLIVSVNGFMFALDALTGRQLWENEMAGFGYGVASLVSQCGITGASLQAAAAAAAAAAATATQSSHSS